MPQIINTNIFSLNAQRNLDTTQSALGVSLQRLSSGLRINSARDDAAGLAIAERFTSQIRGLNQAIRNANDGISLAQTAEGALAETINSLQRLRELAIQSANDTNSSSDRASLQLEATQLIAEIDRIANDTQFNGRTLLDGSFTGAQFQVGANANQTISISTIADANAAALAANATVTSTGRTVTDATTAGSLTSPSGVLTINGTAITTSADGISSTDADASANALAAGINALAGTTGVSAIVNDTVANLGTVTADGDGLGAGDFQINGVDISVSAILTGDSDSALRTAINNVSNLTGVVATLDSSNNLILTATDGRNIQLTSDGDNTVDVFSNIDITAADDDVVIGTVTLNSDASFIIDTGLAGATNGSTITAQAYAITATNAISSVDITTVGGANAAISNVDRALDQVNTIRATLGAIQSRFESTISNQSVVAENLSAARSRIRDADFAAETAELTRTQILQQAGLSIVAQANSLPQNVLSLLQ